VSEIQLGANKKIQRNGEEGCTRRHPHQIEGQLGVPFGTNIVKVAASGTSLERSDEAQAIEVERRHDTHGDGREQISCSLEKPGMFVFKIAISYDKMELVGEQSNESEGGLS